MFSIHSVSSDRELSFISFDGEYFQVELSGRGIRATTSVWAGPALGTLDILFQDLAHLNGLWQDKRSWESLDGEFSISATCTPLGHIILTATFAGLPGAPEAWQVQAGLETELGQLKSIAENATRFFHEGSA